MTRSLAPLPPDLLSAEQPLVDRWKTAVGLDTGWDDLLALSPETRPAAPRPRPDPSGPPADSVVTSAPDLRLPAAAAPAISATPAGGLFQMPPPGDDLDLFHLQLGRTRDNLGDLRNELSNAEDAVATARQALELPGQIEEQATQFLASIKSARFSLKIADKVGPLKVFAKALDKAMSSVESVSAQIRNKAREIDQKVQASGYIEKLEAAEDKLQDYQLDVLLTELKVG